MRPVIADIEPRVIRPPKDRVYRSVRQLRSPGTLLDLLREEWRSWDRNGPRPVSARLLQTHYKPKARARVLAEIGWARGDDEQPTARQFLFIQAYRSKRAARRRLAAGIRRRYLPCTGPPIIYVNAWRALIWALPNGPRLRPARIGFTPRRFARFLGDCGLWDRARDGKRVPVAPELVRYVPRRRALFRYDGPSEAGTPLYVKLYAPGQDEVAANNLRAVGDLCRAGAAPFRVPDVLGHDPRRRAVVMNAIPGHLFTNEIPLADHGCFAEVGTALAALHGAPAQPPSQWSPQDELEALDEAMADVRLALPHLEPRIDDLVARVTSAHHALEFPADHPIHANLFGDQVLVDGSGVGLVDWDDLRLGDPLFDLGRLIAHIRFVGFRSPERQHAIDHATRAMLEAYAHRSGTSIDERRLGWHVAVALLLRAKVSALRPLPTTWMADIEASIDGADAALHATGA